MKTLRVALFVMLAALTFVAIDAFAHVMWQAKGYTFTKGPPGSPKVDVIIDEHGVLTVILNDEFMGHRSDFCTPRQE